MTPSIATFRQRLQATLANRVDRRHVIVLGVDGIPYDLACRTWTRAHVTRARSVFPTTSSTAWLTALTGATVDEHGIPGVVFPAIERGPRVDIYSYTGPLGDPPPEDIFSDAARRGYTPIAILGDLEQTNCTWRDQLVHRAQHVRGFEFFRTLPPTDVADRMVTAIEHAIATHEGPCFIWCFLDTDRYIHLHGYDASVIAFLERVDAIAASWSRDHVVLAHSDHGLVPTYDDPRMDSTFDRVTAEFLVGGAGRTRWIYAKPDEEARVREVILRDLPASVDVRHRDEMFTPGSLAHQRAGSIILIAREAGFWCGDDYRYEHGSLTEQELDVPIAEWR